MMLGFPRGRVMLRCPSCGSKLWSGLSWREIVWLMVVMTAIEAMLGLLFIAGWGWVVGFLFGFFFTESYFRVRRAWWFRRHPARCGDRGHWFHRVAHAH